MIARSSSRLREQNPRLTELRNRTRVRTLSAQVVPHTAATAMLVQRAAFDQCAEILFERVAAGTGQLDGFADGDAATLSNRGPVRSSRDYYMREIQQTIISGPVTFSGGASSTGRVFSYQANQIVMAGDLWRELCLLGHWIIDAVILRWAELSARLGKAQAIAVSEMVDLLLTVPDIDRETAQARAVYSALPNNECVWTGKSLTRGFEVDHVIPYSLWRNNQLWNLLPAAKDANRNKSDQIPSTSLLLKRQDAIVRCWQVMKCDATTRFEAEVERFLGVVRPNDWEHQLFGKLRESAEITALHRGVGRWEP